MKKAPASIDRRFQIHTLKSGVSNPIHSNSGIAILNGTTAVLNC